MHVLLNVMSVISYTAMLFIQTAVIDDLLCVHARLLMLVAPITVSHACISKSGVIMLAQTSFNRSEFWPFLKLAARLCGDCTNAVQIIDILAYVSFKLAYLGKPDPF